MIHHMANKMTKAEFKEDIISKLTHIFGVTPEEATYEQYYKAIAIMCKDQLAHEWYDFRHELHRSEDTKTVYYLCMEFLLGRSLKNNLYNMNLTEVAEEALKDFGLTLDMLYECEPDAGLGNGGLGRLAACYLDGLATGGYSSMGYGILYEYGIFKQKIVDGWQTELPDFWLPGGDVWLTAKPDESFNVQFGGNIDMFIAGGARVDPKVLAFFRNMGIPCLQGYGLTETSPMVALNPDQWRYMRNESAGKIFQFTECKIVDKDEDGNGEICFRGPQVMMGYYKNPEATAECMEDGWFHTGDVGYVDADDYVYITGRRKNVIIAANGKNVFPEELEEKIARSPYVEECMVWAVEDKDDSLDRGIYVTLRPDMENVKEALGDRAGDEGAVKALISSEIDKLNAHWPDWKRVKHIVIKKSEFNKTTGMKIRRFVEENKLAD